MDTCGKGQRLLYLAKRSKVNENGTACSRSRPDGYRNGAADWQKTADMLSGDNVAAIPGIE